MCIPAIAFGRRWPLPVLALASAAAAVQMATGTASLLLSLVLGVAGYTVAAGVPRRLSIRAVLAAAAIFGAALLYAGMTKGPAPACGRGHRRPPAPGGGLVCRGQRAARRAYVGLALQAEQQRITEAEQARQAIRQERIRIARELHDVVAHSLAVITVQAGVGRRLMAKQPEQATRRSSPSRRPVARHKKSYGSSSDCSATRTRTAELAPRRDWRIWKGWRRPSGPPGHRWTCARRELIVSSRRHWSSRCIGSSKRR